MISILTPNTRITPQTSYLIMGGLLLLALSLWMVWKPVIFPSPLEVLQAYPGLWSDGLGSELMSSLWVNIQAIVLSIIVGLPLAYMSRIPIITPLAAFIAKLRFVGPSVFFLPLLFVLNSGHEVKVALLMLGLLFYLVTTMNGVVLNIPEFRFDDARTLKMSEFRSLWYVVVRGTVAEALDAIRDNAAMGWAMLMFVEGIVRSEGGVGVMLLNQDKHVNYAAFGAIAISVLLVGMLQDYIIGQVRKIMCPYA